ncbi:MAG TPA: hypothetical protein VIH99_06930 [Bdellovibrionota bacterium]|jgi:hypothetical protein
MKKSVVLPILCLVLTVAACGKKNQDAAVVAAPIAVPATMYPPYPTIPTIPNYPYPDLPTFCNSLYTQGLQGQLSNGQCKATMYLNNNSWFSYQIGTMNTNIQISAGQRLVVTSSGGPKIYVGGTFIGKGNVNLVSSYSGPLVFYRWDIDGYSVNSIQVTTCYSAPYQQTTCN